MSAADKITIDELRKQLQALKESSEEWQRKYKEASELWDFLEPGEGQQVVSAVLIGKLVNVMSDKEEDRRPAISISATDDVDWMDQMGIIDSAYDFIHTDPWVQRD